MTFAAQVFAVNEAPDVTAPGGLATDEDTALVINGFTVDDPDNSQLTVTLTAASTLTLSQIDGLAFTDGDGTADQKMTFSGAIADINAALAGMTYAPTADFNGTGGFDYTLDDGTDQISGSVAINVDAVNDAPVATDDALSGIATNSGPRTIAFAALTGNDSAGPANEAGQALTVTAVGNAVGGSVQIVGGNVVFTPDADFRRRRRSTTPCRTTAPAMAPPIRAPTSAP